MSRDFSMSNELANNCWKNSGYTSVPLSSDEVSAPSQSGNNLRVPEGQTSTGIDYNRVQMTNPALYSDRFYTELQPPRQSPRELHSFYGYPTQDDTSLQIFKGENDRSHPRSSLPLNVPTGQMYAAPNAPSYEHQIHLAQSLYHPERRAQYYGYQLQPYGQTYQQRASAPMYSHQAPVQYQPPIQQLPSTSMYLQSQQPLLYQQHQLPPPVPQLTQYSVNQRYQSQFAYSQPPYSSHSYPPPQTEVPAISSSRRKMPTQTRSSPRNVTRSRGRKPNADQTTSTGDCSNPKPTSPPKSCVVCENPSTANKLGPDLCSYCLSVYQTSVILGQENCSCSQWPASQSDMDHLKFCWRCTVLKCMAYGVRKETVEANQPCSVLSVPISLLPRLFPSPKCSQEFSTPLATVTASDPLPKGRSLLSVIRDRGVLQKSSTESVINVILWTNEIPLFADFSIENRTEILKSALLPLVLVRFVSKLATVLPQPRQLTELQPPGFQTNSENRIVTRSVVKLLFGDGLRDDEFRFTMAEMEALNNSMELYESRLIAYLCTAAFQPSEQPLPAGEIEINRLTIYQRAALRRLFQLALTFKRHNLTESAVSCLSLVLLFDNEKVEVSDDIKKDMKKRQVTAKEYLRSTFDRLNQPLGAVDFYKMLSHLPEIRNLTEKLSPASDEMTVLDTPSGINFVGLKNILTYIYPDYLKGRMST